MATILNCDGSQREDERHANPMLALPVGRHLACDVTMRLLQLGPRKAIGLPMRCSVRVRAGSSRPEAVGLTGYAFSSLRSAVSSTHLTLPTNSEV